MTISNDLGKEFKGSKLHVELAQPPKRAAQFVGRGGGGRGGGGDRGYSDRGYGDRGHDRESHFRQGQGPPSGPGDWTCASYIIVL